MGYKDEEGFVKTLNKKTEKSNTLLSMSLQLAAVGVAIIAGLLIWTLRILNHSKKSNENTFPDLTAQPDFNWKETEPLKARPFKAKYNLTMGGCMPTTQPAHWRKCKKTNCTDSH